MLSINDATFFVGKYEGYCVDLIEELKVGEFFTFMFEL